MGIDLVTDEEVAEFLEHFGVKGQKWGVRRKGSSTNSSRKVSDPTAHLSNDELRKVVDRMRLNQQYADLSKGKSKKQVADGRAMVKKLIDKSGDVVITAVVAFGVAKISSEFAKRTGRRATARLTTNAIGG